MVPYPVWLPSTRTIGNPNQSRGKGEVGTRREKQKRGKTETERWMMSEECSRTGGYGLGQRQRDCTGGREEACHGRSAGDEEEEGRRELGLIPLLRQEWEDLEGGELTRWRSVSRPRSTVLFCVSPASDPLACFGCGGGEDEEGQAPAQQAERMPCGKRRP